ncbi:MAG TPA: CHAT domain-containing protein, partial [Polyangium sp.]|nr:CHAT domain-containing protein [Polyangium sp.]
HRDTKNTDAAALLFGLPWELLHDQDSYLFDGAVKARARRTLPSETVREQVKPRQCVRVLLMRARPGDEKANFIDPRSSALPLVETLHELGDRVKLDILPDGTFQALQQALTAAEDEGDPYQVVHFDGHGVYDKVRGLGLLCFEDAEDARLGRETRRSHDVPAKEIGALLRDRRVPLFVLDACQTAMADTNVDTSVAAELLRQGVVSVVAMRYAVLLSTAKRFVEAFYGALAKGHRIGRAMVEAQHALKTAPVRSDFGSKGRLELQDWMVPVLFQEGDDPQIFTGGVDVSPAAVEARKKYDAVRHGELPKKPSHGFVGRARDLLRIERRIKRKGRVSIVGAGGEGKTALAVEAAHWFLLTKQRERVAFVSVERLSDARAMLDAVGRQLVQGYSVATADVIAPDKAMRDVKNALLEKRTLLVVDNFESLIALADKDLTTAEAVRDIVNLVHELAEVTDTWLITTSRETLPGSSNNEEMRIHSLEPPDARELLANVLREKGIEPPCEREGAEELERAITSLIEAVRGHARSLVLLGPNIAGRGIEATREAIQREMVALEKRYPGDRERSLLASVRVSLDRVDSTTRKKIAPLCVFRQAAPVPILADVLQLEPEDAVDLCNMLVELGLAVMIGPYLLPEPALGEALLLEMDPGALETSEGRWRDGMEGFAVVLHEQRFQDTNIALPSATITLIDLVDALDATLREVQAQTLSAEEAMNFATNLEHLVSSIGQPRALARVRRVREELTKRLCGWSHAQYLAAAYQVDQLLEAGNIRAALDAAVQLRDRTNAEGDIYPGAAYDRATACCRLGRVLRRTGSAEQAFTVLEVARKQFSALAEVGGANAARMEGVCMTEQGDALRALGKLEAATAKYEDSARRGAEIKDMRMVAVAYQQLSTVLRKQGRFQDALEACQQTRELCEVLGEPQSLATVWHQLGRVHEEMGNFLAAEHAYKESLRLEVALGNRAGEADTLGQLGNVYRSLRRLEDATAFYRQAIMLHDALGDAAVASSYQNNLGVTLHELGRLNEARDALKAALVVRLQLGHAGEPWMTWCALMRVETGTEHADAADDARMQAMRAYRAYRDEGGEATFGAPKLVAVVGKLLRD